MISLVCYFVIAWINELVWVIRKCKGFWSFVTLFFLELLLIDVVQLFLLFFTQHKPCPFVFCMLDSCGFDWEILMGYVMHVMNGVRLLSVDFGGAFNFCFSMNTSRMVSSYHTSSTSFVKCTDGCWELRCSLNLPSCCSLCCHRANRSLTWCTQSFIVTWKVSAWCCLSRSSL